MPVLLSNISGNARWFLINTVSNTSGTFQKNRYSHIFTLGHEPPLDFSFTQLFLFQSETKKKKGRKKIEFVTCYLLMQDFTKTNIGNKIERFLNYISNHSTVFHRSILYNTLSLEPEFLFDFHRSLIQRNFILI